MPLLTLKLLSEDLSHTDAISFDFPAGDWERLLRFHEEVERLRSTRFVQNKRGGQIAMKWEVGSALVTNADTVDTEEVGAMLLRLRPFVLNDEECNFNRIGNLLRRRLEHHTFRRHIDLLKERFMLKNLQGQLSLNFGCRKILSVDVVMDWLNSYEYHRDPDKKFRVDSDLGFFREVQNGLPVVLFALVEMIQAILDIDGLVETLMQVESGTRSEIQYPTEWASDT